MEQALYLEKNIKEIKAILNIYASEEISVNRILKRGANSSRADDKQEATIRNRLREFKAQSLPVIDFYRKYGIVRDVNSEFEVNQVYEIVKKQLYPAVYCIIGKKYSGKTTLANVLNQRMGMKVIDFKDFLNEPGIAKRKNDDLFVISSLAARLREEDSSRVILEDFPLKKEHFSLFVKNCKPFEKIFYLNINDYEANERMKKIGYNHPNYIGSSELNKRLFEFTKQKYLIEYLRKQANLAEINVNNHLKLVTDELVKNVQPTILLIKNDPTDESSLKTNNYLTNHFTQKLGFEIINVKELINENVSRFTLQGREIHNYLKDNLEIPYHLIFETIKPVLFKESNNKYILQGYPNNSEFINQFESAICKIQKLIYVSGSQILPIEDNSIEFYFKKSNKLHVYNNLEIDDYVIDDVLGKNRDLSVVYGMPQSGKTSIINHLRDKYNYTVIDFVHLINELKTEKGKLEDPPADAENVEFSLPELIQGFSKKLNSIPLNHKICLENILNEFVVEIDHVKKIFEIAGRPKIFYEINYQEEVLIDRYKHEQNIEEDLNEDQRAAFEETLIKPKLIVEHLKAISYKVKTVYTHLSVPKSWQLFDEENGKNIISIKHDYELDIDNTLLLFAARQQALYVSVPNLIYQEFYNNTETAHQLENSYHKKTLKDSDVNRQSTYYKYNPIHFDKSIVDRLIITYINENSREMEEHGNFVILSGYLNNDLLGKEEIALNLPLDEVMKLMDLGKN
jgi:adenylate kinase family enzyme